MVGQNGRARVLTPIPDGSMSAQIILVGWFPFFVTRIRQTIHPPKKLRAERRTKLIACHATEPTALGLAWPLPCAGCGFGFPMKTLSSKCGREKTACRLF